MREERAEIIITMECDETDARLYVKVVNTGDYPLYISDVVVARHLDLAVRVLRLYAMPPQSANNPIPPNGAARRYQMPIRDDDINFLKGASAIVESNCGEIARKEIPRLCIPVPRASRPKGMVRIGPPPRS